MRQNPHVRICGGLGSATTLVYPTTCGRRRITRRRFRDRSSARVVSPRNRFFPASRNSLLPPVVEVRVEPFTPTQRRDTLFWA